MCKDMWGFAKLRKIFYEKNMCDSAISVYKTHLMKKELDWMRHSVHLSKLYIRRKHLNSGLRIVSRSIYSAVRRGVDTIQLMKKWSEISRELENLRQLILREENMNNPTQQRAQVALSRSQSQGNRSSHIVLCPKIGCSGFVSVNESKSKSESNSVCTTCKSQVCALCAEINVRGDDSHVCSKESIESLRYISDTCKQCPGCSANIHKIEGCSQMFCTKCKKCFEWDTLQFITGRYENPHSKEWLRSLTPNVEFEGNTGGLETTCVYSLNGEIVMDDVFNIMSIPKSIPGEFYESMKSVMTLVQNLRLRNGNYVATDHTIKSYHRYRGLVLAKEMTKKIFERKVLRGEKAREKVIDERRVFVDVQENLEERITEAIKLHTSGGSMGFDEWEEVIGGMIAVLDRANERLDDICKFYSMKTWCFVGWNIEMV